MLARTKIALIASIGIIVAIAAYGLPRLMEESKPAAPNHAEHAAGTFNPDSRPMAAGEHSSDMAEIMGDVHGTPELEVTTATAKPAMAGGVGAAFLTIANHGNGVARITSATSPVAGRVEFHTHIMEDGIARMRPIPSIIVPSHGEVIMRSGGVHVMLFDLTQPLDSGQSFPMVLELHGGESVEVSITVD